MGRRAGGAVNARERLGRAVGQAAGGREWRWADSHQARAASVIAGQHVPAAVGMGGDADTIQAAFRYPGTATTASGPKGFDVVYEGTMSSSIDDGGIEFRGMDATLKVTRNGLNVYREGVPGKSNPILSEASLGDGTITHMQNFFECVKTRREPNAPVEAGVAAAQAGHIGNLAYRGTGQITWPPKS